MAPIPVTEVQVRQQALTPQLFGLGMVQARRLHTLGPTVAGRVQTLRVDVGDSVQAGQVLGSMDPVDLDARIRALEAAQARAQASVQEAQTRQDFAAAQLQRYAQLAQAQATSAESLHLKRQSAMWPRPPWPPPTKNCSAPAPRWPPCAPSASICS